MLENNPTTFDSVTVSSEQLEFLESVIGGYQFREHGCFRNAQRVVIDLSTSGGNKTDRLAYCEGYLRPGRDEAEAHHAWLVLDKSLVVELTFYVQEGLAPDGDSRTFLRDRPVGVLPEDWQYEGTVLTATEVVEARRDGAEDQSMFEGMLSIIPAAHEVYSTIEDVLMSMREKSFEDIVDKLQELYKMTPQDFERRYSSAREVFDEYKRRNRESA